MDRGHHAKQTTGIYSYDPRLVHHKIKPKACSLEFRGNQQEKQKPMHKLHSLCATRPGLGKKLGLSNQSFFKISPFTANTHTSVSIRGGQAPPEERHRGPRTKADSDSLCSQVEMTPHL